MENQREYNDMNFGYEIDLNLFFNGINFPGNNNADLTDSELESDEDESVSILPIFDLNGTENDDVHETLNVTVEEALDDVALGDRQLMNSPELNQLLAQNPTNQIQVLNIYNERGKLMAPCPRCGILYEARVGVGAHLRGNRCPGPR